MSTDISGEAAEILPCPFCGSPAQYELGDPGAPFNGGYAIVSCTGEDCLSDAYHSEKCRTEDEPETRARVIAKWNTRSDRATAALREENERLRHQLNSANQQHQL